MKKILISITNGFSLRYICHTDILKTLIKNDVKIAIISNNSKATKNNLNIDNIDYYEFSEKKINNYKFSSRFYNLLERFRMFTYGGKYQTPEIIFNFTYLKDKKKFLFKIIKFLLNKIKFLRKLLMHIQSYYFPQELFQVIKEIKPDLILTTSLGTFTFDEYLLRISKKLKVKSATVILSWDNTTTRGYPGALPDEVFSWTDIMKKELVDFSDYSENNIKVAGVPHFDTYFSQKDIISKKEFLKKLNIEEKKKIILFVTKGPSTYQYNPNICKIIAEGISNNQIENCHLITRIHPLHYKINKENNEIEFNEALKVFEMLNNKYDCLTVNYPNITSLKQNFEMEKNEQNFIKNLIFYSDIIVNIYSTFNIEGSIFNKPLINIDFDNMDTMYNWNNKYERQSIEIDRNLDHNIRIIKTEGVKNIKNVKDLIPSINDYLNNPDKDTSKRFLIVENEVGPNKGVSGTYIGNKIINLL